MNVIQKLLTVAIITIAVIGGAGYYLYLQYTQPVMSFDSEYNVTILPNGQSIIPPVSLQELNSSSTRRSAASIDQQVDYYTPTPLSTSQLPTSTSGTSFSSPSSNRLLSASGSAYSFKTEKTPSYSGGGAMSSTMLAFGGSSARNSSSSAVSIGGGGGGIMQSLSGRSFPLAVPFANDAPTRAIVDPGGDPDESEMIPVGEGIWILLLLAGAYMGIKKIKR